MKTASCGFLRAASFGIAALLSLLLTACGPAREPSANLMYLTAITDSTIGQINVAYPGRNCHRSGSFREDRYALIAYQCAGDVYIEFAFIALAKQIIARQTYVSQGQGNRATAQRLQADVGIPLTEGRLLIDQRDHP